MLRSTAERLLQKSRSALDRPLSALQLSGSGLAIDGRMTYVERRMVLDFLWILTEGIPCIYDIGAHHGVFSSAFAKLNQTKHVVAFEALPSSFERLRASLATQPKVIPLNVALGSTRSPSTFNVNQFSASSSFLPMEALHKELFPQTTESRPVEIMIEPLDAIVGQHSLPDPTLIKIDVQGFEGEVIRGGEKTIGSARYCVIEVSLVPLYTGAPTFREIERLMEDLGFAFVGTVGSLSSHRTSQPLQMDAVFLNGDAAGVRPDRHKNDSTRDS